MKKEVISDRQGISLIVLFLIGSSSVFTMGLEAKKDLWIAVLLALFMALIMAFIYARLHYIFPGKDLYDILKLCFGNFVGEVIIIILIVFFYYWTADVLVNYGNFMMEVSLVETPQIVPMTLLAILCWWGVREGINVMGRWSELFLFVPVIILITTTVLLIPKMQINNLRPILNEGIKPVLLGAFNSFSFPFGQIFAFTVVFSNFKRRKSPFRIYFVGLILAGIILLITSLVDILVLGADDASGTHYPTYLAISRLNVGQIFQRLEVIIAIVFVLGGFIKIAVLLECTCIGIAKEFRCKDYRLIATPMTLLVINLAFFQYDSLLHYNRFQVDTWLYFTSPFQVFLPIVIWIIAEIKNRQKKLDYAKLDDKR